MLLVAALVFGAAQAAKLPDTPVTFEEPAQRLALLIPKLASQAHTKLKITPEIANDVLLVNVGKMPLDKLAETIASECLGQWIETEDGPELRRSPSKLASAKEEDLNLRVGAYVKAVQERKAKFDQTKPMAMTDLVEAVRKEVANHNVQHWQEFADASPVAQAALRIALAMPRDAVKLVYQKHKVVFTANPNQLQQPFFDGVQPILDECWKQLEAAGDAIRALPQQEIEPIIYTGGLNYLNAFRQGPRQMKGTWWLSANVNGDSIFFALEFRGDVGGLQGFQSIDSSVQAGHGLKTDDQTKIPLRPESQELVDALLKADPGSFGGGMISVQDKADPEKRYPLSYVFRMKLPTTSSVSPDLYKKVLTPEVNDPLGFFMSDSLTYAAKSRKEDMVAWLGDDLFTWSMYFLGRGNPSFKDMMRQVVPVRFYDWKEENGLLTVLPVLRAQAIDDRGSRARFGKVLTSIDQLGFAPEAPMVDWAGSQTRNPWNQYEDYYTRLVNPLAINMNDMMRFWRVMGIYGQLPDTMRDTLKHNNEISVVKLSGEMKARLNNWLFYDSGPLLDLEHYDTRGDQGVGRFADMDNTFLYPDGMPPGAVISLLDTSDPAALVKYPGGKIAEPMTAIRLASERWLQNQPKDKQRLPMPDPVGYVPGATHRFNFFLKPEPKWAMSEQFAFFQADSTTPKKYTELPTAFTAESDRLFKIFMNNYGVGAENGNPPPMGPKYRNR